jgi:hypothetical protein
MLARRKTILLALVTLLGPVLVILPRGESGDDPSQVRFTEHLLTNTATVTASLSRISTATASSI